MSKMYEWGKPIGSPTTVNQWNGKQPLPECHPYCEVVPSAWGLIDVSPEKSTKEWDYIVDFGYPDGPVIAKRRVFYAPLPKNWFGVTNKGQM